jgi:Domain of unknown function (DUF4201)
MARLEAAVKQKEELAEGLHLIDFEQLAIENQALHEKVEERSEEALKLRKKITTTVQARSPSVSCLCTPRYCILQSTHLINLLASDGLDGLVHHAML